LLLCVFTLAGESALMTSHISTKDIDMKIEI
jgi:hypothetical protein